MPRPYKVTFDLLTLNVVSESRVGYPPLCLSVLDLGPYTRQIDVRRASSLNAPTLEAGA